MGNTQVTKFHPVFVGASFSTPKTIKNVSGATIYGTYSQDALPSSTVKDIEITVGSEETVTNGVWLITASEVDTEVEVKNATPKITAEQQELASESVKSGAIAKEAVTAAKVTSELFPGRTLWEGGVVIKEAEAETAGQAYLLNGVGTTGVKTAAGVAKFGEVLPNFINFGQPVTVSGKTTKFQLYVSLWTGIAPASTITFGLYEVTAFGETEKQLEPTVSLTAKSTAAFTTPAAKGGFNKTGALVTFAEGANYLLGFTLSATTAAKSLVAARAQVFVSNA